MGKPPQSNVSLSNQNRLLVALGLIAVALSVLLFSLRVNLGTGLTTIFVVSCFAPRLDPLTHGIGYRLMNVPAIYDRLAAWYQLPVVPWTSLNNSVVLGSLVLGAALFYPVFHLSESLLSAARDWRKRRRKPSEFQLETQS